MNTTIPCIDSRILSDSFRTEVLDKHQEADFIQQIDYNNLRGQDIVINIGSSTYVLNTTSFNGIISIHIFDQNNLDLEIGIIHLKENPDFIYPPLDESIASKEEIASRNSKVAKFNLATLNFVPTFNVRYKLFGINSRDILDAIMQEPNYFAEEA